MTEHQNQALVDALITSAEAYPKLEAMAMRARRRALFSFRIFDARTRLRLPEARDFAEGDDWAALLIRLAKKGVDVRLQVSDFDPIGGAELHRQAWEGLTHLDRCAASEKPFDGALQAICARHPAAVGPIWRRLFCARAFREVDRIQREHDGDAAAAYPGLADALNGVPPHLYPATHHQKVACIDDDFALIGGLDFDERRWDTPDHDRPAEETWRDVSLAVHGAYAAPVARAAEEIWNRCAEDHQAATWRKPTFAALQDPEPVTLSASKDPDDFSVCMTASEDARGLFSFGPKTTDDGTLQTVLEMIRRAETYIYIETQFLRSAAVAAALAVAAHSKPKLQAIIVLPFAPERYAFHGKRDTAMRHAEALQYKALNTIRDAFGDRLALLSPAKPTRRDQTDKFAAYGAGIVYVHSKVLIVDDAEALVGSANLNDRSLLWDTEASAHWRNPDNVSGFYRTIAESWLGEDRAAIHLAASWRRAAEENASQPPDLRTGFLLPYTVERAQKFSRKAFWLPDALF